MVSPYIRSIKEWKIREVITGFLEAKALFEEHITNDDGFVPFNILKDVCNILYDTKENHHLIYKKIIDPQKRSFEHANKFTPNEQDIAFMNNIGLLFHKVMVARELTYIFDIYQEDSVSYQDTRASLERNLHRIAQLFQQGIEIQLNMLKTHTNNIHLITYILENEEFCTQQFNTDLQSLLQILTKKTSSAEAYLMTVEYYMQSGWFDKAKNICEKMLHIEPNNPRAMEFLTQLSTRM